MSNQRSLKEIVDIISSEAGLGKEEINQLINNKMDELGEFVTALGAAHIVAREMRKPCIVGTNFATKIFKTGDLIEVDTNKGTIKILKTK